MSPPPSSSNRTPRLRKPTKPPNPIPTNAPLFLSDHTLYGSARLGQPQQNKIVNQSYVPPGTHNLVGVTYVQRGWKVYELSNHLGNVLSVISDRKEAGHCNDTLVAFYYPDIIQNNDYYPFGSPMEGRGQQSKAYRFGWGGHEKDDGVAGSGNYYGFGDYGLDVRLGRRWRPDPKAALLPHLTPYLYGLNSPIQVIDPEGEFPILINGRVSNYSERASSKYWGSNVRSIISKRTGYKQSEFFYVDGDKGFWPSTRVNAGRAQAKVDAQAVWDKMKETMKDCQITEQLQVVTHSRGSAYGAGYMEEIREQILTLAKKEGIGFAYDENSIIQYSVNLAPHQSNWINYEQSGTSNVNVSHIGDPLSGNDATGDVINVHSIPEQDAFDQHGNDTYNTDLDFILEILESGTSKSKLFDAIKKGYENYDNNRTNGDKSSVKKGS